MPTSTLFIGLRDLLWNPGTGVLVALLLVAGWSDWRTYRIPNWLTVSGMVWGLAWNAYAGPSMVDGLLTGLGGLALGIAIFLPLWLLKAMGAGDVKLMGMVGAFLGAGPTFVTALLVGITGGVAVLGFAIAHRVVPQLARNSRDIVTSMLLPGVPLWRPGVTGSSIGRLPYGVCIGFGTVAFLLLREFWFWF